MLHDSDPDDVLNVVCGPIAHLLWTTGMETERANALSRALVNTLVQVVADEPDGFASAMKILHESSVRAGEDDFMRKMLDGCSEHIVVGIRGGWAATSTWMELRIAAAIAAQDRDQRLREIN